MPAFCTQERDRLELPRHAQLKKNMEEELPKADLLICFGGDGDHSPRRPGCHPAWLPILGVNMGSVGFMAELESLNWAA